MFTTRTDALLTIGAYFAACLFPFFFFFTVLDLTAESGGRVIDSMGCDHMVPDHLKLICQPTRCGGAVCRWRGLVTQLRSKALIGPQGFLSKGLERLMRLKSTLCGNLTSILNQYGRSQPAWWVRA